MADQENQEQARLPEEQAQPEYEPESKRGWIGIVLILAVIGGYLAVANSRNWWPFNAEETVVDTTEQEQIGEEETPPDRPISDLEIGEGAEDGDALDAAKKLGLAKEILDDDERQVAGAVEPTRTGAGSLVPAAGASIMTLVYWLKRRRN